MKIKLLTYLTCWDVFLYATRQYQEWNKQLMPWLSILTLTLWGSLRNTDSDRQGFRHHIPKEPSTPNRQLCMRPCTSLFLWSDFPVWTCMAELLLHYHLSLWTIDSKTSRGLCLMSSIKSKQVCLSCRHAAEGWVEKEMEPISILICAY